MYTCYCLDKLDDARRNTSMYITCQMVRYPVFLCMYILCLTHTKDVKNNVVYSKVKTNGNSH